MILENINRLPSELVEIVYSYLNVDQLYLTNKKQYILFFKMKRLRLKESYLFFIVRNDMSFIFKTLIDIKFNHWIKIKNWRYKNYKFANYIQFINWLTKIKKANKCISELTDIIYEKGFTQKTFKKIKIKDNRWTN